MNLPQVHSRLNALVPRTLELLHREFPNGLRLVLREPSPAISPRDLYPIFYGCFDWHSSVHSHWQVVRSLRVFPQALWADSALSTLDAQFTPEKAAGELNQWGTWSGFEMPYGMSWLLQLCGELRAWNHPLGNRWAGVLAPLENHAAGRLERYCRELPLPVRGGLHNQSAFALGLTLDYARTVDNRELEGAVTEAAIRFYLRDQSAPVDYEPSATDFLSPSLSQADLLCRVLPPREFAAWFSAFLPVDTLNFDPVSVADPSDGQLAHFAGLNLSRAWMMERMARALPSASPSSARLTHLAARHGEAGLALAGHEDYMISHWVPSFAVYYLTHSAFAEPA